MFKYIIVLIIIFCVNACLFSQTIESELDSIQFCLENILIKDQEFRHALRDVDFSSEEGQELARKMMENDKDNKAIVVKILDNYGWLPKSEIGKDASDALFYVIQHSDLHTMEKYFDQLEDLANIGEASKFHSAMMKDRILKRKCQRQIYGTQMEKSKVYPEMNVWPIEDAADINERRKAYGFELTIEEYAKEMGAIYNPDLELICPN